MTVAPFFLYMTSSPCLFVAFLAFFLGACTPKAPAPALTPEQARSAELFRRGRTVYQTQCIACHNANPTRAGSVGPDVAGASLELLQARVLHAQYPQGYTPKRTSKQMAALPHLEKEIEPLHWYLNHLDSDK